MFPVRFDSPHPQGKPALSLMGVQSRDSSSLRKASMQKTSFVRKGAKAASSDSAGAVSARVDAAASGTASSLPAGSKISPNTGQLIISTGLADFDEIIGGGFTVGTLALIEEDAYSEFNQYLMRYFVAEGITCNQKLYVASHDADSSAFMKALPHVSASQSHLSTTSSSAPEDKDMKIAWQYKKYLGDDADGFSSKRTAPWCHSFDSNRTIEQAKLDTAHLIKQSAAAPAQRSKGEFSARLHAVYNDLNKTINDMNITLSKTPGSVPEILRVTIPSLGSPEWGAEGTDEQRDTALLQFLHALKGLLRASSATSLISIPTHLFSTLTQTKFRHYCDYAFSMAAFTDSPDPPNVAFAEHDGFFVVRKMPRINTLNAYRTEQTTYTFKLKRHKLSIDSIHLGPEVSRTTAKSTDSHEGHSHGPRPSKAEAAVMCQPGAPGKSNPLDF